jgi:hypothetical protein
MWVGGVRVDVSPAGSETYPDVHVRKERRDALSRQMKA